MDSFTDYLCFRLGALTRRIQRDYNNRFAELGITLGQSFVLFSLMEADGSSVKDIAATVQLDPPAITGLVDRLVKEGLVERRVAPDDRRSTNIYLTERGREIAGKAGLIAYDYNEAMKMVIHEGNTNSFQGALSALEDMIQP